MVLLLNAVLQRTSSTCTRVSDCEPLFNSKLPCELCMVYHLCAWYALCLSQGVLIVVSVDRIPTVCLLHVASILWHFASVARQQKAAWQVVAADGSTVTT